MTRRSALLALECPECQATADASQPANHCACGSPFLARYELASIRPADLLDRSGPGMWRYRALLPVAPGSEIHLGEGGTPLLPLPRIAAEVGVRELRLKEEGGNPTGTFKARGMAVAVSRARELGLRRLAVPTAGNAGVALAAYAAAAGIEAAVYVPRDAPAANRLAPRLLGAEVTETAGTIADAASAMRAAEATLGGFDVSTLREPYRLEGKKTLGFELFEQHGRALPDVVLYPTGGGTGLLGMWKAWDELEAIGALGAERPRLVAVQSEGCAPVVRAFEAGAERAEAWKDAATAAHGLRVPKPFADRLVLRALRETGGAAVAVSEREIVDGVRELAREGVLACPEGAATLAALRKLRADGTIRAEERVVVYNTGSGALYPEVLEHAARGSARPSA